jgi:hypothetical protein
MAPAEIQTTFFIIRNDIADPASGQSHGVR